MTKSGFAAIVGRPNAGKSTLLNAFVNEKLAIVTSKPQTTRNNIRAIYNEENLQIVFVDTPGVHAPRTRLGEFMVKSALSALEAVDVAMLIVDATRGVKDIEHNLVKSMRDEKVPCVAVVNKADAVHKEQILPIIAELAQQELFDEIIPISAIKRDGVDTVLNCIKGYIKEGPKFYAEDEITDQTERQIAEEIIREKLIKLLDDEVPHGIAVEVLSMKEQPNIIKISANIYCEKASHKGIIIGKKGGLLKTASCHAREDLEAFFGKKIFLEVWVKVKEDWRNGANLF